MTDAEQPVEPPESGDNAEPEAPASSETPPDTGSDLVPAQMIADTAPQAGTEPPTEPVSAKPPLASQEPPEVPNFDAAALTNALEQQGVDAETIQRAIVTLRGGEDAAPTPSDSAPDPEPEQKTPVAAGAGAGSAQSSTVAVPEPTIGDSYRSWVESKNWI